MRIVIFSIGTQGDVRPYVALGKGLQWAGHSVALATGASCESLVREHGLDFAPLTADFLELMARDPAAIRRGLNPLALVPTVRRHLAAMAVDWAIQGRQAAAGADLLIGNGMVALLASSLADCHGIDFVESQLQPVTPCPDIPPMMLTPGRRPLPGLANLGLYQLMRVVVWQMLGAAYKSLRKDLGLRPYPWYGPYFSMESCERRRLLAYSPSLLPPSPHWPDTVRAVGNFQLEEADQWQPPADLCAFLATGPKPLYLGFGSMVAADADTLSMRLLEALRESGQRVVVATGWGGLQAKSGNGVHVLEAAPHDWLFPRVSLAIHHGGAGTTAAAARAGIPSVVIPFFGDQPFWAWCLQRAGAAPPALARQSLSARALGEAIEQALSPAMQARARHLGERLAREDGVASAIAQLVEWGLLADDSATRSPRDEPQLSRQIAV